MDKILKLFSAQHNDTGTMNTTHVTTLNLIMLFTTEQWSAQLPMCSYCWRRVITQPKNVQPHCEKKDIFFPPKDTLGLIVAACWPALWFGPTSLVPGRGGGPSLSWAHPVRLLIHLEPELSQCHQPPIRSIGPWAGDMAQPQVHAHILVSLPLFAVVYYMLYLH